MKKKDFITGLEFTPEELQKIIDLAISYKNGKKLPDYSSKILTLIFANPSLRTHLSFESGMKKMKGSVNVVQAANSWKFEYEDGAIMNSDKQEHIKEAAKVISRYTDLIGLRNSELITTENEQGKNTSWETVRKDLPITQLAKYAEKSVINMESNMYHPCQAMADIMTIKEYFGDIIKKKYVLTWAPHPKALPLATPHSQLLLPAVLGMDITLVHPEGFSLDNEIINLAKEKTLQAHGSLTVSNNQKEAFINADVIVAKSWASLKYFGQWENESEYRKQFTHWTVNEEKMRFTNNAIFLHCLPVRRNVVVTDDVLESLNSRVIDEAENRMWVQMAIISYLLST